jgi:tetratricopeptide (TPR) repeat protein
MIAGRRSKTVAFVAILALTTFGAFATTSAQPADIKAIVKAFQDHYARGSYSAAQIEAQELERLVKARFGADHPYYAVALNKLGIVFQAQGKYTEAEGLFKRALAILDGERARRRRLEGIEIDCLLGALLFLVVILIAKGRVATPRRFQLR